MDRPAWTARVVHAALVAAVLLWVVGYLLLTTVAPPSDQPPVRKDVLRAAFFAVTALVTFTGVRARRRLLLRPPGVGEDAFWAAEFPAILAAWAVAEAGAALGVLFAWLSGVPFMAFALPAVALLALVLAHPAAGPRRS